MVKIFESAVEHLTLLFSFRWHGHIVELIHQPDTVRKKKIVLVRAEQISAVQQLPAKMLLTSCLSWVWRCMVSVFHYAREWTSSGDTWEGMRSGPVGSKCSESGKKTACGKLLGLLCCS